MLLTTNVYVSPYRYMLEFVVDFNMLAGVILAATAGNVIRMVLLSSEWALGLSPNQLLCLF